jgi:tRNA U34 2-thiouridine synthase MnmA/TrmU
MRAIALISGGLDSILAAKVMQNQGIEVIPLNFIIPFCNSDKKRINSLVTDSLNTRLRTIDISNDFLKLLEEPRYGFGSQMNPCIDCKILMLAKAKELMQQWGVDFVVTGEVLGQRPMSQNRKALEVIEKRSGLEGLALRPLSAKFLSESIPEKENWIQREKLLNFSGRTRKPQIELAKVLKIKEYAQPAGGCLLTDPEFSKRLKELITHEELNLNNIELLKIGRHFRISPKARLVVGRNEKENQKLENLAQRNDYLFSPTNELAGPTALGRGSFSEGLIRLSCGVICRYCDLNGKTIADIIYRKIDKTGTVPFLGISPCLLKVSPFADKELVKLRI